MDLVWITNAKYVKDYKVWLSFNNGTEGTVDFTDKINSLAIFEPLKNKDFFKDFKINSWTLEWDNDIDIAPESLYRMILEKDKKAHNNV